MKEISSPPEVSICIPAYNCEDYIGEAINSALKQTYRAFELLIINDASTDGTLSVIKRFNDPRIRVITNEKNLGPKDNWNKCVEMARGKYIKLLHQDDIIYPTCLEKQLKVFHSQDSDKIALVSCGRNIIDMDGRILIMRNFKNMRGVIDTNKAIKTLIRSGGNIIGEPTSILFRKSMAVKAGKFDDSIPYLIDLDYWLRLMKYGSLYLIPEALCGFRISPKSWSSTQVLTQREQQINFIYKIAKDKQFNLSPIDILRGRIMVTVTVYLRKIIYFYLFTRKSKQ